MSFCEEWNFPHHHLPACLCAPKVCVLSKNKPYLAREEAGMVMCGAINELIERAGFEPRQIDILVCVVCDGA
jgi:hypothetical protein